MAYRVDVLNRSGETVYQFTAGSRIAAYGAMAQFRWTEFWVALQMHVRGCELVPCRFELHKLTN